MKHRTSRAVTALVVGGAILFVAACSSSGGSNDSSSSASASSTSSSSDVKKPTSKDVASVKGIKVTGKEGTEPTVTFKTPFTVSTATTRIVSPGTGEPLKANDFLAIQRVDYDGTTGKKAANTGDSSTVGKAWSTAPGVFPLDSYNFGPDLSKDLAKQKVGTRFIIGGPASTNQSTGEKVDPQVIVGEVTKVVPKKASGTKVTPPAGLPTVTTAASGEPSISIPKDYKAPTDLVVQPTIKGSGPAVKKGQSVTVQYSGWTLKDGKKFDSTWGRNKDQGGSDQPFSVTNIGNAQVIKAWNQGLIGQTVGSQVLMIVPPAYGYGDQASGSIPANSTLVFVIDILDAS